MEPEENIAPSNKEELAKTIRNDISNVRRVNRGTWKSIVTTVFALGPIVFLSVGFIGTHWSDVDAMFYLLGVIGFMLFISLSTLPKTRIARVMFKHTPTWTGQALLPTALVLSVVMYGVFAALISILGDLRLLTIPLFLVNFLFCAIGIAGYLMSKRKDSHLNWQTVMNQLGRGRGHSKVTKLIIIFVIVSCVLALLDIIVRWNDLWSVARVQGLLLLLAFTALAFLLTLFLSMVRLYMLYEDEAQALCISATKEPDSKFDAILASYNELRKNGPRNSPSESRSQGDHARSV